MRNPPCSRSSSTRGGGRYGCRWKLFTASTNTTWYWPDETNDGRERQDMSDTTLEQQQGGGTHPETGWNVSREVKRTAAVILCSALVVMLGVVFTRVIA